jgi:hypothetical protein
MIWSETTGIRFVLHVLNTEASQPHEATEAAEESLRLFQNRYAGGVDTYLQVVTSQTTALSKRSMILNATASTPNQQTERLDTTALGLPLPTIQWPATALIEGLQRDNSIGPRERSCGRKSGSSRDAGIPDPFLVSGAHVPKGLHSFLQVFQTRSQSTTTSLG